MSHEGIVLQALVLVDKASHELIKQCRHCRTDLEGAEIIRSWESDGKQQTIYVCPNCSRFNLFWKRRNG